MDNQHRLIKTYSELSAEEIEAMNACKVLEAHVLEMQAKVLSKAYEDLHSAQDTLSNSGPAEEVYASIRSARDSVRSASIAKTDIQTGFMWLIRAIAHPGEPELDKTEVPNGQAES